MLFLQIFSSTFKTFAIEKEAIRAKERKPQLPRHKTYVAGDPVTEIGCSDRNIGYKTHRYEQIRKQHSH